MPVKLASQVRLSRVLYIYKAVASCVEFSLDLGLFFLSVCAVNVSVTEIDKKSARKHICPRSVFV